MSTTAGLVGRATELATLRAALDAAVAGRGALVLVTGEPGIGKTTLLSETARVAADRGAHVLRGRCWDVGGAPAYWPWTQAWMVISRARGRPFTARRSRADSPRSVRDSHS
jgi:predicted ATPase